MSVVEKSILTAAALIGAVSGSGMHPKQPDTQSPVPQTTTVINDARTPETAAINEPFFESNFESSESLGDLIAESERQGKPLFPFAIEYPEDVDMSLDGDQVFIRVESPVAYLSNTDGMLYAGIYGQKVNGKKHIDLSIESGMFTVAEVDEEKGIKIVTQFNFHNSDFQPGWDKNKSREKFKKGQRILTFSGSQGRGEVPGNTLTLHVEGSMNPLDVFAQRDGKILYWSGAVPKKV